MVLIHVILYKIKYNKSNIRTPHLFNFVSFGIIIFFINRLLNRTNDMKLIMILLRNRGWFFIAKVGKLVRLLSNWLNHRNIRYRIVFIFIFLSYWLSYDVVHSYVLLLIKIFRNLFFNSTIISNAYWIWYFRRNRSLRILNTI